MPTPGAQRASSCTPSPGPRVGSNAPDLENIEASRLKPCVPAPAGSSPWPAAEEEAGCSVLSPHGGSRSSRGGLCFSFLLTKSAVDKQEMSSEQQQALSLLSPAPLTFKQHPARAKSVLASQPRGYRAPARPGHPRGGRWRQCWPGPAAGLIGRVPGQGCWSWPWQQDGVVGSIRALRAHRWVFGSCWEGGNPTKHTAG